MQDRHLHRRASDPEFMIEIGLTDAGSVRVVYRPAPPQRSHYGRERRLAVLIYELAAELERRSAQVGARWVVSPEAFNARLDLELSDRDDVETAVDFVTMTLADLGWELPSDA